MIEDDVQFELPLSPLGDLAHPLVRRQLDRIFEFRGKALHRLLNKKGRGFIGRRVSCVQTKFCE